MFKNVLVVDDHASVNYGIVQTLKNNTEIGQVAFTQYCDDAYLKFQKAEKDNNPFDLVISDLTFQSNYENRTVTTGLDLVKLLRERQPEIKIIIYSVENRTTKIKSILDKYKVNGFISKSRYGLKELLEAIPNVWNNKIYTSKALNLNTQLNVFEIDDFDILLLQELAKGISQKQIANYLKSQKIDTNSLSSIEKKINRLKIHFKAKNTTHLIAICKDLGII